MVRPRNRSLDVFFPTSAKRNVLRLPDEEGNLPKVTVDTEGSENSLFPSPLFIRPEPRSFRLVSCFGVTGDIWDA